MTLGLRHIFVRTTNIQASDNSVRRDIDSRIGLSRTDSLITGSMSFFFAPCPIAITEISRHMYIETCVLALNMTFDAYVYRVQRPVSTKPFFLTYVKRETEV